MSEKTEKPPFNLKNWMVPPVLVPLALIALIAAWAALRPNLS